MSELCAPLLNERQLSTMLGVSVATVRRWRLLHQGPTYTSCAAVRYKPQDVSEWFESRPKGGGGVAKRDQSGAFPASGKSR